MQQSVSLNENCYKFYRLLRSWVQSGSNKISCTAEIWILIGFNIILLSKRACTINCHTIATLPLPCAMFTLARTVLGNEVVHKQPKFTSVEKRIVFQCSCGRAKSWSSV